MSFRIEALPETTFQNLFALEEQALAALGARRVLIEEPHSAPCRISLQDAEPGEEVILASLAHQDAPTPYRASGPVFVRRGVPRARLAAGEVPAAFRRRLLSLRAYDAGHQMIDADVADGKEIEALIARLFGHAEAAYLHAHFAKRGCYAAKVVRA